MSATEPLRLVIFDCDGTLVDSAHTIVAAMAATWRAEGFDAPPSGRAVRETIGLPLVEAIARLHPEGEVADHHRMVACFKDSFRAVRQGPEHEEPLYPGAVEAISALEAADVMLGVATGKSRRGLEATLGRHGLLNRFAILKTADDGPGKPNPDILFDAMAEAGTAPETTAVVGDTVFDMEMASGAGAAAIGVAWGYHDSEELTRAGAQRIIHAFDELMPTIETLWSA